VTVPVYPPPRARNPHRRRTARVHAPATDTCTLPCRRSRAAAMLAGGMRIEDYGLIGETAAAAGTRAAA